jgi:REP element-mobilizing transposase RayT
MSYRQIYYHIVFGTKERKPILRDTHCEELYKFIWGIIKNKGCKLYQINGSVDHLHLLSDLHPSISLANFIKDIKVASSIWLKQQEHFSNFDGWAEGYAAFTISHSDRHNVIAYIKSQKEHHHTENFIDELRRLLKEFGIEYDEKYLP